MAKHNLPPMFVDPDVSNAEVWVRLQCNHYTSVHEGSSTFDFPYDPLFCQVCEASQEMKPYLQRAFEIANLEGKWDE